MSEQASILIVDDNPAMAQTLVDILAAKGYLVHAAYSGGEALKILEDNPADILLTDVRMPDMNGVELFRETQKFPSQPITFLMTAYAADDIIQAGIAEGIKTILTKPLDIDTLLMLFSAAINTYGRRH